MISSQFLFQIWTVTKHLASAISAGCKQGQSDVSNSVITSMPRQKSDTAILPPRRQRTICPAFIPQSQCPAYQWIGDISNHGISKHRIDLDVPENVFQDRNTSIMMWCITISRAFSLYPTNPLFKSIHGYRTRLGNNYTYKMNIILINAVLSIYSPLLIDILVITLLSLCCPSMIAAILCGEVWSKCSDSQMKAESLQQKNDKLSDKWAVQF